VAINLWGIRLTARLSDLSVWWHIGGVLLIVLTLAMLGRHHNPLSFLFAWKPVAHALPARPPLMIGEAALPSPLFRLAPGLAGLYATASPLLLFVLALLQAQWTYTGYDASAHTIEETKNARVSAPWGIYLSVAISGLFGYVMLALVTLAIKDLNATAAATTPFIYIFKQALGGTFADIVLWIVTLAMWFCGLSCVTSTSRMVFAFARDQGMPLSRHWARVSRRFRTPAAAVWLASVLAFFLVCLIFGTVEASRRQAWIKPFEFSTVYQAVTGISTIGLYLSYGIPLLLKLRAIRRGVWTERANGPWNLGNWTVPVNVIALVWIAFITVLFVLPPNELTGFIFAGTFAAMTVYYLAGVRGEFRGPVPQARSQQELLTIEAELER
jgi:amino acid transporter